MIKHTKLLLALAIAGQATILADADAAPRNVRKEQNCSAEILFIHSLHHNEIAVPARKRIVLRWPLEASKACNELMDQALPTARARAASSAPGEEDGGTYGFKFNPGSDRNCRHLSCF